MPSVLLLDNYDSFSFNLVELLRRVKTSFAVATIDEISPDYLKRFSHLILSPGPGIPGDYQILFEILDQVKNSHKVLGVCLGFQVMGLYRGAEIERNDTVYHGYRQEVTVTDHSPLFSEVPSKFFAGRYHSWYLKNKEWPVELTVTARDNSGMIMAYDDRELPFSAVQFHPESIMTEYGEVMIRNFINL